MIYSPWGILFKEKYHCMSMTLDLDNYALFIKTTQSTVLKNLFDALKEIIHDVNIVFSSEGMKILATDNSKVAFVNLKLSAEKFNESGTYHCPKKLTVGISIPNLNKFMKSIVQKDICYIYIHNDHQDSIGIKMENSNKNIQNNFSLNILDIEEEQCKLPKYHFNCIFTMPSVDFQKLCRDMLDIDKVMEIQSIGNKLIFRSKGDIGSRETIINNNTEESQVDNSLAKATFSLKHLVWFSKASLLCPTIHIYFTNDAPLIIDYSVGSLGYLKLWLAPKIDPDS